MQSIKKSMYLILSLYSMIRSRFFVWFIFSCLSFYRMRSHTGCKLLIMLSSLLLFFFVSYLIISIGIQWTKLVHTPCVKNCVLKFDLKFKKKRKTEKNIELCRMFYYSSVCLFWWGAEIILFASFNWFLIQIIKFVVIYIPFHRTKCSNLFYV